MIEAYGLALAHLSELQRRKEAERARYDLGRAEPFVPRGPGLMRRLGDTAARIAALARGIVPPERSPEWDGGAGPAACARRSAFDRVTA